MRQSLSQSVRGCQTDWKSCNSSKKYSICSALAYGVTHGSPCLPKRNPNARPARSSLMSYQCQSAVFPHWVSLCPRPVDPLEPVSGPIRDDFHACTMTKRQHKTSRQNKNNTPAAAAAAKKVCPAAAAQERERERDAHRAFNSFHQAASLKSSPYVPPKRRLSH